MAIAFNCVCVFAVFKRRANLRCDDVEGLVTADRAMKLGGAIVPTFLVAFSLGQGVAAGGHGKLKTKMGDFLVVFAPPKAD